MEASLPYLGAALEPKSESFVDRLLEAPRTKRPCLDALKATPVKELIETLLKPPTG
jgi:hypothetical protein